MKHFLISIKEQVLKLHNFIKEMDQIPFRGFQDELYDKKDVKPVKPTPRKNNVKVEDLRPQRPSENAEK